MNVETLFADREQPSLVITPRADASIATLHAYVESESDRLETQLATHGAILFRGFALRGADDFRAAVEKLGATPFTYVGGNTPRSKIARDVFTSTEVPATEAISAHNEMSYLPTWPRRIFFYAVIPAADGGQTPLTSGHDVMAALPSSIVRKFQDRRLAYIRNFQPSGRIGKSWQLTYDSTDPREVERIIATQGSTHEWRPNGVLRVRTECDAVIHHTATDRNLWFNQAEQWHPSALPPAMREMFEQVVGRGYLPHDCEHADGTPLDTGELDVIRDTLRRCKRLFEWQPHDLLMVDNTSMMHGREPYTGERRILAYLSAT